VTAAVQHALCADDLSLAAAILEAAVRPEMMRGDTQQAQEWLTRFPNNALDQYPHLLLDWCLLEMMRVQTNLIELVARTEAALALAQLTAEERRRAQAELTIFTIIARFYRREFDTVRQLVQDKDQCLADAEPLIQGMLAYVQMHLAWYEGQFDYALTFGSQAIEALRDAGFDHIVISIRIDRARISAQRGYPREALAMLQELVAAEPANGSFVIQELALAHVNAMNLHYWMDDIESAQREQQSALALARRLADPDYISEIASLDALFDMARVTGKSSEIEASWPQGTVSTILQLNKLHFHQLVRQGQLERAWHFATAFGVRLDNEITAENLFYFIMLLEVTIARGSELESVMPRLADAFAQAEIVGSRLFVAELYALSAWAHLQLERREEAEDALSHALDLAVETGYVRFIIDIPALASLLAFIDHPAAAGMWVATVSEAQRQQAAKLTAQERLVLAHLSRSGRYQDIADSLCISINTVRTHIRHIYAKLGVTRREEAVDRAIALGLTKV
ncbi:MAG: LuxR C-terminal-related transcriptional regulator, partial [Anderseniella sp.]|nr:LuxR C-terminal-related transcriptional regulator [Anderseniella sp.]